MLALEDVRVAYGNVEVLRGVSLHVAAGGRGGRVTFLDARIDGRPAHEILRAGIAHCPEGRRIFPDMTVRENLEMGAFVRGRAASIADDLDRVLERFPVLRQRARQLGGTLS